MGGGVERCATETDVPLSSASCRLHATDFGPIPMGSGGVDERESRLVTGPASFSPVASPLGTSFSRSHPGILSSGRKMKRSPKPAGGDQARKDSKDDTEKFTQVHASPIGACKLKMSRTNSCSTKARSSSNLSRVGALDPDTVPQL